MYLYSKASQDCFFEHPEFAFLFVQFAKSESSRAFYLEKFKGSSDDQFTPRMVREIENLAGTAEGHLKRATHLLSKTFTAYLDK